MLPNPNDLEHFLQVMASANMSRAAERLGMTQPALSLSVKRLEGVIGQVLFLRSKTGVVPTRAGEKLAVRAKLLLADWHQLAAEISKDQTEVRGRFNLGVHSAVARYTLPLFLPALLETYGQLEFRLFHDLSRKITEDVVSFKVDFGLVVNPFPHPDLVIRELLKDRVSFWCAKKRNHNNSVGDEACTLLLGPDLRQTQELLKKIGKKETPFKRILTSSSLEVLSKLTASGAGVGILPARVALQEGKKLQPLAGKWPVFEDRICLVYRSDVQKSYGAKQIIAFIQERLKE